jgi:probable rRNA maturation factor
MTSQIKRKAPFQLGLDLQFASAALESKWSEIFSAKKIRPWVKATLQQDSLILIRLVGLAESKRLNRDYREQDHSTNILTFTLTEDIPFSKLMADLVLCMPIIEKEAKIQGKTIENHIAHLIVHGVLHAQGFDHEDEIDALAMETLEIAILKRLKIKNPYI